MIRIGLLKDAAGLAIVAFLVAEDAGFWRACRTESASNRVFNSARTCWAMATSPVTFWARPR